MLICQSSFFVAIIQTIPTARQINSSGTNAGQLSVASIIIAKVLVIPFIVKKFR